MGAAPSFALTHTRIVKQLLSVSLKRRQVSGPYACAKATMELLRNTVGACKWATAAQLMEVVRAVGRELIAAKPSELAVGNVVRRVLFVIREEYASKLREQEECVDSSSGTNEVSAPSLETVLGGTQSEADFTVQLPDLKQSIIEGLNELKAELEDVNSIICEHAAETIHANEVVLTFGRSDTVEQFLLAAADQYRKSRLTFRYVVISWINSHLSVQEFVFMQCKACSLVQRIALLLPIWLCAASYVTQRYVLKAVIMFDLMPIMTAQ
jgi:translation initiation factor 2B subunit (eIF-2B alpha/beta/delta family)